MAVDSTSALAVPHPPPSLYYSKNQTDQSGFFSRSRSWPHHIWQFLPPLCQILQTHSMMMYLIPLFFVPTAPPELPCSSVVSREDAGERCQVFRRPLDVTISVEYFNASFLVKKPSDGFCLVPAFTDVGRYSRLQRSCMPVVNTALGTIARWNKCMSRKRR